MIYPKLTWWLIHRPPYYLINGHRKNAPCYSTDIYTPWPLTSPAKIWREKTAVRSLSIGLTHHPHPPLSKVLIVNPLLGPFPLILWTYLILSKNFKSQNSARISNSKTQQEFRIPKLSKNFESQNTPTKVKFAVVRIQSTNFTECSTTSMTFYMNNKLLSSVLVIWVMRQMITTEIQMTITAKI